jgi:hypothetical protein
MRSEPTFAGDRDSPSEVTVMRTRPFLAAAGFLFILCLPKSGQAQSPGIGQAFDAIAPNLTIRVVRETSLQDNPSYCDLSPNQLAVVPWECNVVSGIFTLPLSLGFDAGGNAYYIANSRLLIDPQRYAYVLQQMDGSGRAQDLFRVSSTVCQGVIPNCLLPRTDFTYSGPGAGFPFDVTNGRILLGVRATATTEAVGGGAQIISSDTIGIVELSGFPKMFDTLLTFVPGQQALNIVTPAMPDGFRSADSLQVWTGDVRSMPDWSQAQPLACSAATSPTPGQVLTVPDALPDPAVGRGRYYLVASQSGPDRRLGRQYVNGTLSAREPAGLPVCY